MPSKVSKLWLMFAKNVKQKFVNKRKILIILLSNFDPKFYNVLSKICLEPAGYESRENNEKSSQVYSETWQGSQYVSGYS